MTDRLAGRIVLIVGGSGAIGQATATRLAELGAIIVLGYNSNETAARAAIAGMPSGGHDAIKLNVAKAQDIAAAAHYLKEKFGRLDILINASGMTRRIAHDRLDDLDDALFDEIMQTNVRCLFSVVREFVPLLRRGDASCIVNVSSTSAKTGRGSNIAYCAAKAAVDSLGLTLARALGPEIRVLTVAPGSVDSSFVQGRTRDEIESQAKRTALGRVISAEDVASAILACVAFLPASSGSIISIDGCPI